MHPVDLIRRKRDGQELSAEEIRFLAQGAAVGTIPEEQLSAWLMAVYFRGLSAAELAVLTEAMRDSGERFSPAPHVAVDKHSTGGVGDKTSFLVAPIAAAAGLWDPMISGRALGHTGGTLDKLESIPGLRTQLSLDEMRRVLERCGFAMAGQTPHLVPADRVLYALRDRTATIESPSLICASIMSKKLAAGLNALVLDVKTGSGAFLRDAAQARLLAALMVETGERAGTRTVALLTSMDEPLGRFSGNFVEIAEAWAILKGERHPLNEGLRSLSLTLAGWMLHLGGKRASAKEGYALAEQLLEGGEAAERFRCMVEAQGGDAGVLDRPNYHTPRATRVLTAERDGYLVFADCAAAGWAVQRLGAGRERPGEAVDAHAGIELHASHGAHVKAGQPLVTLFAAGASRLDEPERLMRSSFTVEQQEPAAIELVHEIVSAADAQRILRQSSGSQQPR